MKCYIAIHQHRHGSDAWPIFVADDGAPPTERDAIEELGHRFEPEFGESVEIKGPFAVPEKP
jgi:hypothetical protein